MCPYLAALNFFVSITFSNRKEIIIKKPLKKLKVASYKGLYNFTIADPEVQLNHWDGALSNLLNVLIKAINISLFPKEIVSSTSRTFFES